jgi:molybdopterin molybdotransferase
MISQDEAYRLLDSALSRHRLQTQCILIAQAKGRTTASDHLSVLDLPPFDKSSMDGYAVGLEDTRDTYQVLATLPAGQIFDRTLEAGCSVQIMTGAPIPRGAGRVIKVENTHRTGDFIQVTRHEKATHVCCQAEDLKRNQVIVPAGVRLSVVEMANLVACGLNRVNVVRKPKVFILSTGDELVDSPTELVPGKIFDSNGPMLAGLAENFGLEVVARRRIKDDPAETISALKHALSLSDLVVLSGGVSMGTFDYVPAALEQLGLVSHFSEVAIKPGKPAVFASSREKSVFGLPGNPVSAFVMFHLFVLRAIAHLLGEKPGLRHLELPLAKDFKRRRSQRLLYMPGRLNNDGSIQAIAYNGSGHLASLMDIDGFFIVPVGTLAIQAGQKVPFALLPRP